MPGSGAQYGRRAGLPPGCLETDPNEPPWPRTRSSHTPSAGRSDAELQGMALQAMAWDTEVFSDSIDVEVNSGVVTLKGDVSFQFQSDAAYDDVANVFGVIGITNEIKVINPETTSA
jgi:BON domain